MTFEELKTKYHGIKSVLDWFAEDYPHAVASGKIEEWKEMLALFSTVIGHETPENHP